MVAQGNLTEESDGGTRRGLSHSFRALRHRDFAVFWTGAFITNAGAWFQSLAVPYVLLLITGNALWVGLATAAQFVPVLVLGPAGGRLAERGGLRRTLLITQGARCLAASFIFACWVLGVREPLVFLLLAFAAGAAQGISMPAWQAFVFELTGKADLPSAVTLNTLQFNLSRSFGPALGGAILLLWGPALAFLLAFLAILCVLTALCLVQRGGTGVPWSRPVRNQGMLRDFAEAWTYSRNQPGIMLSLLLIVCIGTLGMPVFQHVIVFAELVYGSGEAGLTLLNLGLGLGTLLAAPIVAGFEQRMPRSVLARWSTPLYGMSLAAFALSPNTYWGSAALLLVGAAFLASISVANTSIQMLVADHMRGRVLALNVMVYTGSVALGAYLQGWLSDAAGPRATPLLAAGLLTAVGLAQAFWRGRHGLGALDDGRPAQAVG